MSEEPRKILVRGVNWLGDAVMSTPALIRLRERYPEATITVLTPEKLGALYLHHPAVDRSLMFSKEDSALTIGMWLLAERFDLGILFPNSPRSALEMFLGRVKDRVGFARPLRTWMLTDPIKDRTDLLRMRKRSEAEVRTRIAAGGARETYPSAAHHTNDYLRIVAEVGASPNPVPPLLRVTEDEREGARGKFGIEKGCLLLGINAGAEYGPAKRWPEESFIAAAEQVHRESGCSFVVLGGGADVPLAEKISAELRHRAKPAGVSNVAGKTSLRELAAVLADCDALLTNDTGPMHVAAAVGTPVVVPFGSTSPELTGPGLPGDSKHRFILGEAPCAPCFLRECPVDFRCLRSVSSEMVAARVLQSLRDHPKRL